MGGEVKTPLSGHTLTLRCVAVALMLTLSLSGRSVISLEATVGREGKTPTVGPRQLHVVSSSIAVVTWSGIISMVGRGLLIRAAYGGAMLSIYAQRVSAKSDGQGHIFEHFA